MGLRFFSRLSLRSSKGNGEGMLVLQGQNSQKGTWERAFGLETSKTPSS